MDLTCYLHPGWNPKIRAAESTRKWMTETPESFAYRCLPLNIANAHGWEILNPLGFEVSWNGGAHSQDVSVRIDNGQTGQVPVSLFGQGTVTFHITGLFRTPPGYNMWVGGSPNYFKDGAQALTAIIEQDWSPYSFTMNWKLTRPTHWVRFEVDEPICFFFPLARTGLDAFEPRFAPIDANMDLKQQYCRWSQSRDAFHAEVERNPPTKPADKWQKLYYTGKDADGKQGCPDHKSKLRLKEFK